MMIVVDCLIKDVILISCTNIITETVVCKLLTHVIAYHGVLSCDDLVKLIYASAVPSLWLGILVFCHLAQWLSYMNAPIKVTMTMVWHRWP